MSFEFNLPLQTLRESFVLATSRYVDERAATSRECVAVPPKSDSQALRHEQREPLLAAAGAARSPFRFAAPKRRTVSLAASSVYSLGLNVTPAKALKRRIGLISFMPSSRLKTGGSGRAACISDRT